MTAPVTSSKRVNVTLSAETHERARALGVNVSAMADAALREAVRKEEARLWREENAHILRAQDEWLARNGHPFADAMEGPFADAWHEPDPET